MLFIFLSLQEMSAHGIVERAADDAMSSDWALTAEGMSACRVVIAVATSSPAVQTRDDIRKGRESQWELWMALEAAGWQALCKGRARWTCAHQACDS